MGKLVYLRSVINNTFCYEFTIQNLSDFNFIGGEDEFSWRPSVSHLIHWQEIRGKTWNIQHIIEITMVNINPTLLHTVSQRVISQNYWWTSRHVKRGKYLPCQNHMCRSSIINDEARWTWGASNQGMYSLLVFWIWSSFPLLLSNQEGIFCSSPGFGSTFLSAFS